MPDSHLSVTDRCMLLRDIFVGLAMGSTLCESRLPKSSERGVQVRFNFCVPPSRLPTSSHSLVRALPRLAVARAPPSRKMSCQTRTCL